MHLLSATFFLLLLFLLSFVSPEPYDSGGIVFSRLNSGEVIFDSCEYMCS